MITRRWLAGGGLLGLLTALTFFGAPPGVADDGGADSPAEPPKVELVLDVSGSMRARDIDGRSRMSVAQQAFNEVVDALPAETQLGIRVLGRRPTPAAKELGCRDTQQLVPVGPMDRVEAKAAIATLRPTGFTPIGLASARRPATSAPGRRRGGSCSSPTARTPAHRPTPARWPAHWPHRAPTWSWTPSGSPRTRRSANSSSASPTRPAAPTRRSAPEELTGRIKQLVERAARHYQQTPPRWPGASSAPTRRCSTPGVYTDRERFSEHRWYRVRGPAPGQELRASVSLALDRQLNPDYGVLLRAVVAGRSGTRPRHRRGQWPHRRDVGRPALVGTAGKADASPPIRRRVRPADGLPGRQQLLLRPRLRRTAPGMPLELTIDLVPSSARADRARTWAAAGCCWSCSPGPAWSPVSSWDWLARWRVAIGKGN